MSRTSLEQPKVPEITPQPRKNKTITFRVTDNIYEVLETAAEQNNITLSALIAFALEDYLVIQEMTHKTAQYINSVSKEKQAEILRYEENFPSECRNFAAALKSYPNAGKPAGHEAGARGAEGA